MSHRLRRSALSLALILAALVAAPAAHAFPVTVNLRVEGPNKTVFDGPVTTDAHDVTTQTAGTHKCDGTNGAGGPGILHTFGRVALAKVRLPLVTGVLGGWMPTVAMAACYATLAV